MSFSVGDIPFFEEYQFTDNGETAKHFGLVLLPEEATQYQESILCCVITSQPPAKWCLPLEEKNYPCFNKKSYACFNRKDLVSKRGLGKDPQPRGQLTDADFPAAFKTLKKSLFVIKDIASDKFLRGAIIFEWKQQLSKRSLLSRVKS